MEDVLRLGVAPGDLLMVHASLRAVGPVAGRADGLLDAIAAAVGPEGTMLMTLGARDDWSWVNERPEHQRAGLLAGAEPFDAATTPADPDNGVLSTVRCRPRLPRDWREFACEAVRRRLAGNSVSDG